MTKLEFNNKKTEYLNLIKLLIVVRDYKVKLTNSEANELAKYELDLKFYLDGLKDSMNLINLDKQTKNMLSYNNISSKRISDKELFNQELNLINEIKKYSTEL